MRFKKLLIIIGIFVVLLYLVICTMFWVFSNREIFYTRGGKYGNCTVYEDGKMIVENKSKENEEIKLNKNELKTLKKLIIKDKEQHSDFVYPGSNNPQMSVDKVVWSYGYYYSFLYPSNNGGVVYDGESSKYVYELLEKYCEK